MIKKENELAICIPTYNRESKLKQLLQCIAEECEKLGIVICVSDNASDDDTERMVHEFMNRFPNIRYHKNITNIGALGNFNSALAMVDADYKWLMGDDDLIVKNQLRNVLAIIHKHNPQLLIVNGGCKLSNGDFKCNVSNIKSQIYEDNDELLGDVGYYMSWMSCLIIRNDFIENYTKYNWTAFWHTASLLTQFGLRDEIRVYFESTPVVYSNNFESGGDDYSSKVLEYFTNDWFNLSVKIPNYNEESREKFRYGHRNNVHEFKLKDFLSLRLRRGFNYGIYKKIKSNLKYASTLSRWIILMIAILPPFMPDSMYRKLRTLKNKVINCKAGDNVVTRKN